jgi:hypothetical protein
MSALRCYPLPSNYNFGVAQIRRDTTTSTAASCDDLRCDLKSCRKLNIYSPQYDGVHMIASASNDVLQLGSHGKFLQRPHHKFMTANWRVNLRARRQFTAHQFGATSDCCEYKCACRLAEGKQIAVSINKYIVYVVLVMARPSS